MYLVWKGIDAKVCILIGWGIIYKNNMLVPAHHRDPVFHALLPIHPLRDHQIHSGVVIGETIGDLNAPGIVPSSTHQFLHRPGLRLKDTRSAEQKLRDRIERLRVEKAFKAADPVNRFVRNRGTQSAPLNMSEGQVNKNPIRKGLDIALHSMEKIGQTLTERSRDNHQFFQLHDPKPSLRPSPL